MIRLCALLSLLVLAACPKVPLQVTDPRIDFTAAHYFENEKTEYLFFSVAGLRAGQARVSWPSTWEMALDQSGAGDVGAFQQIDFNRGVFAHHLVECGPGRLCGSFSFHAERAPARVSLRYRFHEGGALTLSEDITTQIHSAAAGADAQSAFVYGVFNHNNRRLEVRWHDNFGAPTSDEVASYGLERSFAVDRVALSNLQFDDETKLAQESGTPFLYPASACDDMIRHAVDRMPVTTSRIQGGHGWWPRDLSSDDPTDTQRSACLQVRTLDRTGATLRNSSALARRNPVLVDESLALNSPLKTVKKIPLILSYCANAPGGSALVSEKFLSYQRFILGFPDDAPVDLCFQVGREADFNQALAGTIQRKLAQARAAGDGSDFVLTVAINERLDPLIGAFHDIIAAALANAVKADVARVSPRLVGAFVYDSHGVSDRPSPESRQVTLAPGLMWCPREGDRDTVYGPNCSPLVGQQVTLGPINFLIPMGPFPALEGYLKYSEKYGDAGRAGNPALVIQAPSTNENSAPLAETSGGTFATFLDGERFSLAAGEAVKLCADRDAVDQLGDLAFKITSPDGKPEIFEADEIAFGVLGLDSKPTAVNVGWVWHAPFIGAFAYDIPLQGQIFNFIPISKTLRDEQAVGDPEWSRRHWEVGHYFQKCLRNCDHPYFDEAGTYQLDTIWSKSEGCPATKAPEPTL